jgi:uncharacterized protein (DUF362 family)
MPEPSVSVVRIGEEGDITKAVEKAVKLTGGLDQIVSQGETILLKPNAKNTTSQGLGVNTDLRVIESLLNLVLEQRPGRVIIAEGAAYPSGNWDTMAAFKAAGITEIANREKVDLYDLNTTESVTIDITDGLVLKNFTTGKIVLDADVIINIPVIKTHVQTLASICLKNLAVGIAKKWEKKRLHSVGLDKSIVDIYANVKTHFNIVDGIVGVEGDGPNVPKGEPKPLGIILAGGDGLSVDAVGCTIMDIDPWDVPHLRLASEIGLGTIELNEIRVLGEPLKRIINPFKRPKLKNP